MNYKQNEKKLVLSYDDSRITEVSVEDGEVVFFSDMMDYDDYYSDCVTLDIEEWEKVKEWVDSKTKKVTLAKEITNPYLIYEMAIGGGCTEKEAKVEMMKYCKEVGLDPLCP